MIGEPDSPAARAFMAAAEQLGGAGVDRQLQPRPTIPLTVVR